MIGGRNFEPAARTTFTVAFDGATRDRVEPLRARAFSAVHRRADRPHAGRRQATIFRWRSRRRRPPSRRSSSSTRRRRGRSSATARGGTSRSSTRAPALRWRWLSERGELRLRAPSPRLTLHLEGESPLQLLLARSRLVVRSGDRVVFDRTLSAEFSLNIPIEAAAETISLETDQVFAPADRSRRSAIGGIWACGFSSASCVRRRRRAIEVQADATSGCQPTLRQEVFGRRCQACRTDVRSGFSRPSVVSSAGPSEPVGLHGRFARKTEQRAPERRVEPAQPAGFRAAARAVIGSC